MSNNGVAVILPIGPSEASQTTHAAASPRQPSTSPNVPYDAERPGGRNGPRLDVREQTVAILHNVEDAIRQATNDKGGLGNIIGATVFLVDMKRDYASMNGVWNRFWPRPEEAPARTTVGVRELPGEEMAVEVKRAAVVEGGEQWDDRSEKRRRLAERSSVLGRQPGSIPGQLLRLVFCLRDGRIPPFHSSLIDELRNRHLG
ncbi:L-PSP endoribonuclease family [Colletotrichum tofieldiae]|nr:L-PSP endoribonuclease family [Colletotrichum tofieldiae]